MLLDSLTKTLGLHSYSDCSLLNGVLQKFIHLFSDFNFSRHSNELMMVTSLKNVELPESGVIHLQVKISDSGQPPLFTLLDIDITVVGKHTSYTYYSGW